MKFMLICINMHIFEKNIFNPPCTNVTKSVDTVHNNIAFSNEILLSITIGQIYCYQHLDM